MTPYARLVLDAVEEIPRGRVMSYGDVADYVGAGSARTVGMVMARHGSEVAWHRVLRNDGTCAPTVSERQIALLRRDRVPFVGGRVDMARARWDGSL